MSRRETQIQQLASKMLAVLGLAVMGALLLLLIVPTTPTGAQGTSASSPPLTGTPGQVVYFGADGTPVSSTKFTFDGNCLTLDTGMYCDTSVSLADPGDGLRYDDMTCNTVDPGTPDANHYFVYYKCGTGYIIKDSTGAASVIASGGSFASYLPLTAGSAAKLTALLYTRGVLFDQDGDGTATTCLNDSEADDRIFGDKDCDGTKDAGEEWVDGADPAGAYLPLAGGTMTNNIFFPVNTGLIGASTLTFGSLDPNGVEAFDFNAGTGSSSLFNLQVNATPVFTINESGRVTMGEWRGLPVDPTWGGTGATDGSALSLRTADTRLAFPTYSDATATTYDTGTLVAAVLGRTCVATSAIATGVIGNCATDYNTGVAVPFLAYSR